MGKTLDFTKQKKEYLTVKLNDDKGTVLMIGTPSKKILSDFIAINDRMTEDGTDAELIDDLYKVCAKIMSFNKGGIKISADYLADLFDLEDIVIFFRAYADFMHGITSEKN